MIILTIIYNLQFQSVDHKRPLTKNKKSDGSIVFISKTVEFALLFTEIILCLWFETFLRHKTITSEVETLI